MKNFINLTTIGFLAVLALTGCKSDDSGTTSTPFTPTPYTLELNGSLPVPQIPEDNQLTVEGVDLGKKLFFDKLLSGDNTQSCASCHNQDFAFTDNEKALSEGIDGLNGNRNAMPIYNLLWHKEFFWDGRAEGLRNQAVMPIQDELEMNQPMDELLVELNGSDTYPALFKQVFGTNQITEELLGMALEQYMHSIVSANSKYDQYRLGLVELTPEEKRGFDLFFQEREPGTTTGGADCFHCHGGALLTNNEYMNNGLETEAEWTDLGRYKVTQNNADKAKFKVPSLRNIEKSGPYMHDGRMTTLEEVIEHYNSGIKVSPTLDPNMNTIKDGLFLSDADKKALVAFLKTLTDNEYITNPNYKE